MKTCQRLLFFLYILLTSYNTFATVRTRQEVRHNNAMRARSVKAAETIQEHLERLRSERNKKVKTHTQQRRSQAINAVRSKRSHAHKINDDPLKPIDLVNIGLSSDGYPTIATIKDLVAEYWPSLGNITVKQFAGGANSGTVLGIFNQNNRLTFVFKVSTANEDTTSAAWENLAEIQRHRVNSFGATLKRNPKAPIITSVERFFRYFNGRHQRCVIEVTHAAQGAPVSILLNGTTHLPLRENLAIAAMVGRALGTMHSTFATNTEQDFSEIRTMIHGDFHPENVYAKFINNTSSLPDTLRRKNDAFAQEQAPIDTRQFLMRDNLTVNPHGRVYFIDNETIKQSLHDKKRIDWDVLEFIFVPMLYWKHVTPLISERQFWRNIDFYKQFLNGYVEVFPQERQAELNLYLKNLLRAWLDLALTCVTRIAAGQEVNADLPEFKPVSNPEASLYTWQGFITILKESSPETLDVIKSRLDYAAKQFLN